MTAQAETDGEIGQEARPGYGEGRGALLEAAVRVVARGGLRKLTYRAVAAEAGVTHGLVAHHFGSRDTLLEEALRWCVTRSIETSSLVPASGRLEDFAATLADFIAADPDVQAFQYELKLESSRRPELRHHVDLLYDTYRDAVREALACFDVSQEMTEIVFAALEGLVFHQVTSGAPERTEESVDALRRLLAAQRAQAPSRATGGTSNEPKLSCTHFGSGDDEHFQGA
ncbi:TetR family transcriptional regulator [Streptomyces sp. Li-HN-5-11]|uniref:TetR/AcrR family transcriptional regulator n=1 Tax=Streptomyces sp. Li-HN-5-11 TaxID=3075432 RepID=UPI0028A62F44|nr:TetR family transcriptional regulator [Streptomyces sp. Li-HN-5-11]WNM34729.1 TetR family transcriptional regulator [Streptomyces sp. Li-HN-5-11]